MAGPLTGMQVVELAHIMSGPICGVMLADMGAEVIKVEKIPKGTTPGTLSDPALGRVGLFLM